MNVRAPMLLDDSFVEIRRLEPAEMKLSLNLTPPSTADMTVPFDTANPIPIRAWVRLYTIHGDAGIYRVSASDTEYDSEEQRLTLEHGLTSLHDTVIPSLADREADSEVKKTAGEMLSWLLAKQPSGAAHWQAGSCAASENVILDQNGSSLFEMLLEMLDQLPEYDLTTDQTSYPWTVSIVPKQQAVTAEGRLSRNLGSVRVTYDDSELCTRVYMPGLSGGYMDADTQSLYGVVEQSNYLSTDLERGEATRIATRYLEKRKEPAISVELDAVDLSKATGETIDAFLIGKKFRLTIPSYGLIVDQWITGIEYEDVYSDPEHVTLTLGNRIADIAYRAAKTQAAAASAGKSARGGGGGGSRQIENKLYWTYMTKSDTEIAIGAVDKRVDDAEASIRINAGEIELRVRKDNVISSINQTAESITINANRVNLQGYVNVDNLYSSIAAMTALSARNVTVTGSFYVGADKASWQSTAVVTSVSLNTSRAPATGSIALTSDGVSVSGGTSFNYGRSVTVKKRDLYYLGQPPGSEY